MNCIGSPCGAPKVVRRIHACTRAGSPRASTHPDRPRYPSATPPECYRSCCRASAGPETTTAAARRNKTLGRGSAPRDFYAVAGIPVNRFASCAIVGASKITRGEIAIPRVSPILGNERYRQEQYVRKLGRNPDEVRCFRCAQQVLPDCGQRFFHRVRGSRGPWLLEVCGKGSASMSIFRFGVRGRAFIETNTGGTMCAGKRRAGELSDLHD